MSSSQQTRQNQKRQPRIKENPKPKSPRYLRLITQSRKPKKTTTKLEKTIINKKKKSKNQSPRYLGMIT
jgi:hypothetical protein